MSKPPPTRPHDHFAEDVEEQVDPHGFSSGHSHGHVIMPLFTLRTVLVLLLVFTALTVFAAQAEQWFMATFHVHLPGWVNVAGVLLIATIKSVIVAMYFMQLKYDNPINTVVMLFSLFAVALFLGFTMIDLGVRDKVYAYKAGPVIAGGTGGVQRYEKPGDKEKTTVAGPIVEFSKKQFVEHVGPEKFGAMQAESLAHSHRTVVGPSRWQVDHANQSRSKSGVTGALDTAPSAEPMPDGHTGGH